MSAHQPSQLPAIGIWSFVLAASLFIGAAVFDSYKNMPTPQDTGLHP